MERREVLVMAEQDASRGVLGPLNLSLIMRQADLRRHRMGASRVAAHHLRVHPPMGSEEAFQ